MHRIHRYITRDVKLDDGNDDEEDEVENDEDDDYEKTTTTMDEWNLRGKKAV